MDKKERPPPPIPEKYKAPVEVAKEAIEPVATEVKRPKPPTAPRPASQQFTAWMKQRFSIRAPKPHPPSAPRPQSSRFDAWMRHKSINQSPIPKNAKVDASNPLYKGVAGFNKLHESKLHHRLILAAFAISMLWATSLGVARSLVENNFIPRPRMSEVRENVETLYATADDSRISYAACTSDLLEGCTEEYEILYEAQINLVADSQAANEERIDNFTVTRALAKRLLNDSLEELSDKANNEGLFLANYTRDSTANDCPRVRNWIEGQYAAARAQSKLQQFNENTTGKVNVLSEALAAREAYDQEYFANKTVKIRAFGQAIADSAREKTIAAYDALNATLQSFRACMGVGGGCPTVGFLDAQANIFSSLQLTANNFEATINATKDTVNTFLGYASQVQSVIGTVKTEIAAFPGFGGVAASIPTFSTPGPPGNLNGIEANFDLISTPGLPGSVPNPLDIDANVGQYFENIQQALIDAKAAALIKVEQFATEVEDFYGNFTFDVNTNPPYNPPSVFAEDQEEAWNNSQEENTAIVNEELETYKEPDETNQDEFRRKNRLFNRVVNATDDIIAILPERNIEFFAYPASIFDLIQTNLILVGNLALWADICYRVLHTLIIIHKYWSLSSIGKPPGDVRYGSSAGQAFGQKMTPDQRLVRILTHPLTLSLVVFVFLGLLISSFWYAYSPFFYRYSEGCVQYNYQDIGDGKSEGTMFYRNAFASAYQYAAKDGDQISSRRVDEANLIRDADCRENFQVSSQIYQNQVDDYALLVDDYLQTRSFNTELIECLDLPAIDNDFGTNLETRTSDVAFSDPLPALNASAVYNCSATSVCTVRCEDPPRAPLEFQSHVAACTFEYWLHASFLGWLMIILVFILINWFRIEFVAAVVRIWWRRLSPGKFSFLGSCTRDGEKIYPEKMEEEGKTFEEVIEEAVDSRIKSWEKWGYIHAAYALSLNIPWIVFCSLLSQGLVYNP